MTNRTPGNLVILPSLCFGSTTYLPEHFKNSITKGILGQVTPFINFSPSKDCRAEAEANLEYLVKAWNNHDTLKHQLALTLAALETPGDLTKDDLKDLIEDGNGLLSSLE